MQLVLEASEALTDEEGAVVNRQKKHLHSKVRNHTFYLEKAGII